MAEKKNNTPNTQNKANKQEVPKAQKVQRKSDTQNIKDAFGSLFAEPQQEAVKPAKATAKSTAPKQKGRPPKAEEDKKGGYRINLNLDEDLDYYLYNKSWQDRTSITDYINNLVRKDMESYFKKGGSKDNWQENPKRKK